MAYPVESWDGRRILTLTGTADTAVPYENRGTGPLRERIAGRPAVDLLDVREGGDHSGENGSYLQVPAMTSFLGDLGFGTPPPVPVLKFDVRGQQYKGTDGIYSLRLEVAT